MKVKTVINPESKTGMGKKGAWTQAQVELEDGERILIFQPIAEGDEVESYQNGEYINWRKIKPVTMEQTTIINMLIDITKKLDQLLGSDEL